MRIVFHAGLHKTGTTSLQRALESHAPLLTDRLHVETRQLSPALVQAATAARTYSQRPDATTLAALKGVLQRWAAGLPDKDLVVSSEDFMGHMPQHMGVQDYSASLVIVPTVVAALQGRFAQADIRVLITTRAAEPWLQSLHWQLAKKPGMKLMQRRFCREFRHLADFPALLGPMAARLAPTTLEVRALEDIAQRRLGPVEAVYDLIGLPDTLRAALPLARVANQTPPGNLADQFVRLNRAGLAAAELEETKAYMLEMMRKLTMGDD